MKTKKVLKGKQQLIECELKCGNTSLHTHIESRFKKQTIKEGMEVILEDDDRVWIVKEIYGKPIEKHSLNHGWNNNI